MATIGEVTFEHKEPRRRKLTVTLNATEKAGMLAEAQTLGVSVSEFVRGLYRAWTQAKEEKGKQ